MCFWKENLTLTNAPVEARSNMGGMLTPEYEHWPGRHVTRSHWPQVTQVAVSGVRPWPWYQSTNCDKTSLHTGPASTMSWVIPVSSVQKGVNWGTPTGYNPKLFFITLLLLTCITLMYLWNVSTTWNELESTNKQGNSMISWGSNFLPFSQFASKSRARKYLNFCCLLKSNELYSSILFCSV